MSRLGREKAKKRIACKREKMAELKIGDLSFLDDDVDVDDVDDDDDVGS